MRIVRPPSVLERDLALQARLLHDADEDILEREPRFSRAEHMDARPRPASPRSRGGPAPTSSVDDHVQAIAEQRHAPAIHRLLEPVGRALRIVDVQLQQMAVLARS